MNMSSSFSVMRRTCTDTLQFNCDECGKKLLYVDGQYGASCVEVAEIHKFHGIIIHVLCTITECCGKGYRHAQFFDDETEVRRVMQDLVERLEAYDFEGLYFFTQPNENRDFVPGLN